MQVAIDSSVLVSLLNPSDHWRTQAVSLRQALLDAEHTLLYFDCVVSEAISAALRRLSEKKRQDEAEILLQRLELYTPSTSITWVLPDVPRLYPEIITLMKDSGGQLNFHDALIALTCRERTITAIASFDSDFDQIPWLNRLTKPTDLPPQ